MYCCTDQISQRNCLGKDLLTDAQFQNYPSISIRRLKYSKRVHITVDRREKGIHRDTSNKLYPQGYTSSEHFLHNRSHLLFLANSTPSIILSNMGIHQLGEIVYEPVAPGNALLNILLGMPN